MDGATDGTPAKRQMLSWRYTFIPMYALSYGLSTFIALYILAVGGSVFDVGIALAIYYAVSIPSSLLFGALTDRFNRTKPFIVLSAVMTLPILVAFLLPGSVGGAWLYYALYAIAFSAANPALNILIMGRQAKRKKMPKYYSKYGVFSILGLVLASLLGIAIPRDGLGIYMGFLLAFNVAAIALAALLVRDQPVGSFARRQKETRRTFSIMNLLSRKGMVEYNLIDRLQSMVKRRFRTQSRRRRSLYWLLFAIVLFNIGYYVFYASYVPFQVGAGLSYSDVFVIQLFNALAQLCAFIVMLQMIKRPMLHRYFVGSSALRGVAYLVMLASVFMPVASLFAANLFAYMIGGVAIAFWNLSSTVLLYHRVKGMKEGHYLGLWSGLVCASAIVGSFASGALSSTLGYAATFSVAVLFTAASGIAFALELKEH